MFEAQVIGMQKPLFKSRAEINQYFWEAKRLLGANRLKKAEELYEMLYNQDYDKDAKYEAANWLGVVYELKGNCRAIAREFYKEACRAKYEGVSCAAKRNLADVYIEEGNYVEAKKLLKELYEQNGYGWPEAKGQAAYKLANLYMKENKVYKAIMLYEDIINDHQLHSNELKSQSAHQLSKAYKKRDQSKKTKKKPIARLYTITADLALSYLNQGDSDNAARLLKIVYKQGANPKAKYRAADSLARFIYRDKKPKKAKRLSRELSKQEVDLVLKKKAAKRLNSK